MNDQITAAMLARTPKAVRDRLERVQRNYNDLRTAYNAMADGLNNVPGHRTNTAFDRERGKIDPKPVYLPDDTSIAFSLAPAGYEDKNGISDDLQIRARVKYDRDGRAFLEVHGIHGLVIRPEVANCVHVRLPDEDHARAERRMKKTQPCGAAFKDARKCTQQKGHAGPHADKAR